MNDNKINQLTEEINHIEQQIADLQAQAKAKKEERTLLYIHPFKSGDTAICQMAGKKRTKEPFKCIIEVNGDMIYATPFKNDGTLSGRHFIVTPDEGKTLRDCFSEVKDN